MHRKKVLRRFLIFLGLFASFTVLTSKIRAQDAAQNGGDFSNNPNPKKLPTGVLLVKGAWASASDSVTPLPESGKVSNHVYRNPYFGLTYALSSDWTEKYSGPPPSDSGYYVLAQIQPSETFKGTSRGSILIAAQDLFFTPTQAKSALEMVLFTNDNLQADYKVERPPTGVKIAGHPFVRFDYFSPVADLHWHVLATQSRCHVIEFIFTSRDTKMTESLIQEMEKMQLSVEAGLSAGTGGGDVPVCIQDYAREENIIERVDPVFTERRFNPVPVRIIISKEGKVKHIHFLSAFPDQAKAITDTLSQWKFKPYLRNGQPVEVETGIVFGRTPRPANPSASSATTTE